MQSVFLSTLDLIQLAELDLPLLSTLRLTSKKPKFENQSEAKDHYDQVYTYKSNLNYWVNTGIEYNPQVVTFQKEGIVTPQIISILDQVKEYKQNKLLDEIKIYPNTSVYYYLLKSQNFINIVPIDNNIEFNIDTNRLIYHVYTRNYCIGSKGPSGEKGPNGINGLPGPSEQTNIPSIVGNKLTLEKPIDTPLETDVSLRLYLNNIIKFEIIIGSQTTIIQHDPNIGLSESSISFSNNILVATLTRTTNWEDGWTYKARQKGPQGKKGNDGSEFISIKNTTVNDTKIRFTEALRTIRINRDYNIFTIKNSSDTVSPVNHLRINSDDSQIDYNSNLKLLDNNQPDYWISVEPSHNDSKQLYRWGFKGTVNYTKELDFPHWTPLKVCGYGGWTGFDKAEDIPCCQEDLFLCTQTLRDYECTQFIAPIPFPDPDETPPPPPPDDPCENLGGFIYDSGGRTEIFGDKDSYIRTSTTAVLNLRYLNDDDKIVLNGSSDDVALLIGHNDSINIAIGNSQSLTVTIPINYILFRDTSGWLMNPDAVTKTFRVGINGPEYTFNSNPSTWGSGHVIDMEAGGFETRDWSSGITKGELKDRGWVDEDGICRFKVVHIVSGGGFVSIASTSCVVEQ